MEQIEMSHKEINRLLRKHKNLNEPLNLSGQMICNFSFEDADLKEADFSRTVFENCQFMFCDLNDANFAHADLTGCRFMATLSGANCESSFFRQCMLEGSSAKGTNFHNTLFHQTLFKNMNTQKADFSECSFLDCSFDGSDLRGADFSDIMSMSGTSFYQTQLAEGDWNRQLERTFFAPLQCPEEGSFIGFKKLSRNEIAKLLIPEDAKRSSATSRRCRCSKAKVLSITTMDGKAVSAGMSSSDNNFIYKVGETVYADSFDDNRWDENGHGINFFPTKQEAESYGA